MPKIKKLNNSGKESPSAWRTPVKLPTTVKSIPMNSLYNQSGIVETDSKAETQAAEPLVAAATDAAAANRSQEISNSDFEAGIDAPKNQILTAALNGQKTDAKPHTTSSVTAEKNAEKRSEAEFLRLLKTDKMDFYSLAEILRGSSMALYCVLYSESVAKGAKGCQIRQTDLMMRAEINNPATLYKQERWLTALGLISKSVRLGNHNGASYDVQPLEILPLPQFILAQFDGYLSEFTG